MTAWTLDDIAWHRFDPSKVDRNTLAIVKAASLVEHNGSDYAVYLCRVFDDDPVFQAEATLWGQEEIRHGEALGRWAHLADPGFDFGVACRRFSKGFHLHLEPDRSVRGTRAGEMIARCVVETGTSSYYTALAEATEEPVLKEICQRIAADEFRHYRLFYKTLQRYQSTEPLGLLTRLRVAAGRIVETDDDELAYAYHAANDEARPYDRRRCSAAYASRAYAVYRRHHIARGIAMVFKAVGLTPYGRASALTTSAIWRIMQSRQQRYAKRAA
jgi:hypothetical protein